MTTTNKQQMAADQAQLTNTLNELQTVVKQRETEQQSIVNESKAQTALLAEQLAASEENKELLNQRLAESEKQTAAIQQQMETLDEVVDDLATERQRKAEKEAELAALHERALQASFRASGLQTASMFKTMIAEYYMTEGRFPDNNRKLMPMIR